MVLIWSESVLILRLHKRSLVNQSFETASFARVLTHDFLINKKKLALLGTYQSSWKCHEYLFRIFRHISIYICKISKILARGLYWTDICKVLIMAGICKHISVNIKYDILTDIWKWNIDRYMNFFKNDILIDICRKFSFFERYMKIFIFEILHISVEISY